MNDRPFHYRVVFPIFAILLLVSAGCAQKAEQRPVRPKETVAAPATAPAEIAEPAPAPAPQDKPVIQHVYSIDAAASEIRILVYRKGNLSRLGHDHVISTGDVSGRIVLAENIGESALDLTIPVTSLVVDDPQVRERADLGSGSQPSEKDRESTRRAMLGPKVLDAERFGAVKVHAKVVGGALPDLELDLNLTIHGVERQFRSPVRVDKTAERISASGSLAIRQSDFGIEPFSVLAGALAVKDELRIQYRIVASRLPDQ
jgi:polyisoprenoid-binding protein YceI